MTTTGRVREALLDAAYDAVVGGDWASTRMADVAAIAGVSRQTLYNEFGGKDALAQALAWRETERFLDGVDRALADFEGDPAEAIAESVRWTLDTAAQNPLLKAVLTSTRDADLLPFLTTRAEPLLDAARDRMVAHVTDHWPELSVRDVRTVAEVVVRLTVSHLVLSTEPTDTTARTIALLVSRMLRPALEATA